MASEKMELDQVKKLVRGALEDLKAADIVEIDMHGKTSMTDTMVIATGSSNRHVKSISENVVVTAKQAGIMPVGIEGDDLGEWVLVDLGDVIVHVMQARVRDFYQIEKLWSMDLAEPGTS